MRPLLQNGVTNLFLGHNGNNQAAVAYEAAFQEVATGNAVIVALVDTPGDAAVLRDRFALWLSAREHNPDLIKRLIAVKDWRRSLTGVALLALVMDALGAEHRNSSVTVLLELSGDMISTQPDDRVFQAASDLIALLPHDAMVVLSIATGPDGMPVPKSYAEAAQRVYRVQSSGTAMRLMITPMAPLHGNPVRLQGRVAHGGVVLVDDDDA